MDNERYGIPSTGDYAVYNGRNYIAHNLGSRVRLFSDDDPLPSGFKEVTMYWTRGEKLVNIEEIEQLFTLQTTCVWRGHPFSIGAIISDYANITYLGKDFDDVGGLPGMQRPDKYEVRGTAPVSELSDIETHVITPPGNDNNEDQSKESHR